MKLQEMGMKPETRDALDQSIEHWEQNEAANNLDEVQIGSTNCALCKRFRWNSTDNCEIKETGEKCPVYIATGETGCEGSPYVRTFEAKNAKDMHSFHQHATEMLDFLKFLRPKKDIKMTDEDLIFEIRKELALTRRRATLHDYAERMFNALPNNSPIRKEIEDVLGD